MQLVTEEQQLFATLNHDPDLVAMVSSLDALPPPTSSVAAQQQHVDVARQLGDAQAAGRLTAEQMRTVTSYLTQGINTGLGHDQEKAALEAYTAKTGATC
jgi:hypothetical protein